MKYKYIDVERFPALPDGATDISITLYNFERKVIGGAARLVCGMLTAWFDTGLGVVTLSGREAHEFIDDCLEVANSEP